MSTINRDPEPVDRPPLPHPVPHPIPVPPTPAPGPPIATDGSGSIRAADGSAITWTTAADGTVTATGSAGRQMIIRPVHPPVAPGVVVKALQTDFTAPGQGTYLTIDRSIDETNHVVSVGLTRVGSQITLVIRLTTTTTGTGTATGRFGIAPFEWNGPADTTANPFLMLGAAAGPVSAAFKEQLAAASYFGPAIRSLAIPPTPSAPVMAAAEGWGEFLAKAAVWGVAALAAAALTAGTGGLDLLVGAAVFGTGAGASMANDEITAIANDSPIGGPPDDPGPGIPAPPDPGDPSGGTPDPVSPDDPGGPGGGGGGGGGGGDVGELGDGDTEKQD